MFFYAELSVQQFSVDQSCFAIVFILELGLVLVGELGLRQVGVGELEQDNSHPVGNYAS